MTRDELKTAVLAGCDKILMLPRLLVGYEQRRIIYATQSYWQTASDAELDRLLGLVPQAREEEAPPRPKSIEEQLLILDLRQEAMIRLLEEMLDTLARLDPSPFSPRPQRRDAMSAPNPNAFAAHPQLAQLHQQVQGMDLSKVNLLAFLQFVQSLFDAFTKAHAAAAGAGPGPGGLATMMAGCDKTECLRAHFETIEQVAVCGVDCCNAP
jgi:hypothetical protein